VWWDFGYCGHYWPIVPAPDDIWWWLLRNWWNEDWQGKPMYSEKTCPSATFSTTNPTWLDPDLNPCRCGGKPTTNRLSYGAAYVQLSNLLSKISYITIMHSVGAKYSIPPVSLLRGIHIILNVELEWIFIEYRVQKCMKNAVCFDLFIIRCNIESLSIPHRILYEVHFKTTVKLNLWISCSSGLMKCEGDILHSKLVNCTIFF
jgi:hypothetical protein